jgi:parallel beta-helix repeat protein
MSAYKLSKTKKLSTLLVITFLLLSSFVFLIKIPTVQATSEYTFGYTTDAVSTTTPAVMRGLKATPVDGDGNVTAIMFKCAASSGTALVRTALYEYDADSDAGAFIAETEEKEVNTTVLLRMFNFSTPQSVTNATDYYLVYWANTSIIFYYNSGGSIGFSVATPDQTYPTWDDPLSGESASTASLGIYAIYESDGLSGGGGDIAEYGVPDSDSIANSNYVLFQNSTQNIVYNVSSSSNVYNSSNPVSAFSTACSYVDSGGNLTISNGTYTGASSFEMNYRDNIYLRGEGEVTLTINNWVNDTVLLLDHSNGCNITNINIDGNKANQKVPSPYETINGITFAYSDFNIIDNCFLNNSKRSGIESFDSENMTIQNSLFTYNGWNGITVGGGSVNCSVINNDVSHSSDVGISVYGTYTTVRDNYVHDCDTMDGSPIAAGSEILNNSHWGIGTEDDGTGTYLYNNTVLNCRAIGIVLGGSGTGCTVEANNITRSAIGIGIDNAGLDIVKNNLVNEWFYAETPFYYGRSAGIYLIASPNTNITGNILFSTNTTEAIGILTENQLQSIITDNVITSSTSVLAWNGIALKITNSNSTVFARNILQATSGFRLSSACVSDTFYENDFTNCTNSVWDVTGSAVYWNNTALDGYSMLNATVAGSGTTIINGIASDVNLGHQFIATSNASVTWTPSSGSIRVDFDVDGSNQSTTTSPVSVNMASDHTVIAYFMEGEDSYVTVASFVTPENTTYTSSTVNFEVSTVGSNDTNIVVQVALYNQSVQVGVNQTTLTGSFTGLVNGTYTAAVYAVGDNGASDYTTVIFTVAIPEPTYYITVMPTAPENTTYTESSIPHGASLAGNGTSQEWSSNVWNGTAYIFTANMTSANATFTLAVNGTYRIDFWASDAEGSTGTANVTFTVAIGEEPEPTPTPTATTSLSNAELTVYILLVVIAIMFTLIALSRLVAGLNVQLNIDWLSPVVNAIAFICWLILVPLHLAFVGTTSAFLSAPAILYFAFAIIFLLFAIKGVFDNLAASTSIRERVDVL